MTTDEKRNHGRDQPLRVDLIDDRHEDWPKVCAALDQSGEGGKLKLADGRLSARQSLLVARAGDEVAGHLCFHVEPARRPSPALAPHVVHAELDVLDVRPGFCEDQVKEMLVNAAVERAAVLKCQRTVGFEAGQTRA